MRGNVQQGFSLNTPYFYMAMKKMENGRSEECRDAVWAKETKEKGYEEAESQNFELWMFCKLE